MKFKSFYTEKEMVTKLNREPTEGRKIFAAITKIYRELKKINSSKSMTQ
jgi:hypothetical protein